MFSFDKVWNQRKRLLVPLLTILGLVGLFAVFFFLYVPSREAILTQRHFGMLADMSDEIRETFATLHNSITNAISSGAAKDKLSDIVAHIEPPVAVLDAPTDTNTSSRATIVCRSMTVVRSLHGYSMGLRYDAWASPGEATNHYAFTSDFGELLRPITSRHGFPEVLLIRSNEVLFQKSLTETRATNSTGRSDFVITRMPAVPGRGTNFTIEAAALQQVPIAGDTFEVFSQPLRLSLDPDSELTIDWFICGLVRSSEFRTATWQISPTVALIFVFAVAALLLAWPFLNVLFSHPLGELRRAHVICLLTAGFFACSSLTGVFLYTTGYIHSEREANQKARELGSDVLEHLKSELRAVDTLLQTLDTALASEAAIATNESQWRTNIIQRGTVWTLVKELAQRPAFSDAAWLGSNGQQLAKWMPKAEVTKLVSVKDRAYFQRVYRDSGWPRSLFGSETSSSSSTFYLESVFSKTRNENTAVFARKFSAQWPEDKHHLTNSYFQPQVSAITFRPSSLFDPVLPAGYGFSIIEPNGRVLFHSDSQRNLRENFFKATAQSPRVRAAFRSGTEDEFDGRYHYQNAHIHLRPVPETPWMLAVVRQRDNLAYAHQNMVFTSSVLFCLYSLLLLLFVFLLSVLSWERARKSGKRFSWWLWPNPPWGAAYDRCRALAGILALICFCGLVFTQSSIGLLLWGIAAPVTAFVAAGILGSQLKVRNAAGHCDQKVRASYSSCWGWALVLLAVLPSFACYKVAFLKETRLLAKGMQLKLARDVQDRAGQLPASIARAAQGGQIAYWQKARHFRLTNSWSRYLQGARIQALDSPATFPAGSAAGEDPDWFNRLYRGCRHSRTENGLGNSTLLSSSSHHSWVNGPAYNLLLRGGTDRGTPGAILLTAAPNSWSHTFFPWPLQIRDFSWYVAFVGLWALPSGIALFMGQRVWLVTIPRDLARRSKPKPIQIIESPSAPDDLTEIERQFIAVEESFMSLKLFEKNAQQLEPVAVDLETGRVIVVVSPEKMQQLPVAVEQYGPNAIFATLEIMAPKQEPISEMDWCLNLHWSGEAAEPNCGILNIKGCPVDTAKLRHAIAVGLCGEYRSIWRHCTPREKLTLYQVARTGYVLSTRAELRNLLCRGLLKFGPDLSLCQDSFKRFVLAGDRSNELQQALAGEATEARLGWMSLRGAIGIAITVIALLLFFTQRNMWELAVAFAGSFAIFAQELSKAKWLFNRDKISDQNSGSRG